MFGWIWTALIGVIVGALAKLIMPGKDGGGILVTMLIGIAGSVVATFVGRTIGWYGDGDRAGFVMSIAGAVLLLWLYKQFFAAKTT
jgi:uncharacterized membrane protein YeaQ/YmgE (transglycosylase-associated protein family)